MEYGFFLIIFAFLQDVNNTLSAELLTPTIITNNCNIEGGETHHKLSFSIKNPSPTTMKITYKWFEFPTHSYKLGKTICNIPPNQYALCHFTIPIALGGKGNGTIKRTMIILNGSMDGEEYVKSFEVEIIHFTTISEESVIAKMYDAEKKIMEIEKLSQPYINHCPKINDELVELKRKFVNANTSLMFCNISNTYRLASEVIQNSLLIRKSIDECISSQKEINIYIDEDNITTTSSATFSANVILTYPIISNNISLVIEGKQFKCISYHCRCILPECANNTYHIKIEKNESGESRFTFTFLAPEKKFVEENIIFKLIDSEGNVIKERSILVKEKIEIEEPVKISQPEFTFTSPPKKESQTLNFLLLIGIIILIILFSIFIIIRKKREKRERIDKLRKEKEMVEKVIGEAKVKLLKREISQDVYEEIIKENMNRLIKIDIKIKELEKIK